MQDILKRDQHAEYALKLVGHGIDMIAQAGDELAKSGAKYEGEALVKALMDFRNSILAQHRKCRAEVCMEFNNRQLLSSLKA
jgi:hypothetical protein